MRSEDTEARDSWTQMSVDRFQKEPHIKQKQNPQSRPLGTETEEEGAIFSRFPGLEHEVKDRKSVV